MKANRVAGKMRIKSTWRSEFLSHSKPEVTLDELQPLVAAAAAANKSNVGGTLYLCYHEVVTLKKELEWVFEELTWKRILKSYRHMRITPYFISRFACGLAEYFMRARASDKRVWERIGVSSSTYYEKYKELAEDVQKDAYAELSDMCVRIEEMYG